MSIISNYGIIKNYRKTSRHSWKTYLNNNIDTATTANKTDPNSRSSGITPDRPVPDMTVPAAWIPGIKTGIDTGKKRNERRGVFPSEYMTMAETIDPIMARSMTPKMKTTMREGRTTSLMFRKMKAEKIVAIRTVKRITTTYMIFPMRMV